MGNRLLIALSMVVLAVSLSYALTLGIVGANIPIDLRPLAKIFVYTSYNVSNRLFSAMTPEIVTAVVWDYRGIDTFFEVAVFYVAIVATVALFRGAEHVHPRTGVGLSVIVKTVTKIVALMISVVGAAIVLHGHLTPGGGFQGGSTVAVASALVLVSFGLAKLVDRVSYRRSLALRTLGLLGISLSASIVLLVAVLYGCNAYLFQNQPKSEAPVGAPYVVDGAIVSGTVLPLNVFDGIAVAAGFTLLYILFSVPEEDARRYVLEAEGGE